MRARAGAFLTVAVMSTTLVQCGGNEAGAPDAASEPADAGAGPADGGTRAAIDGPPGDRFMFDVPPPADPPAPPPWLSRDVGAVGVRGRTSLAAGLFFVRGAGNLAGAGAADAFQFLQQTVPGDGEVVAHLAEIEDPDPAVRAGVMIRGSLDPGAPYFALLRSGEGTGSLQWRSSFGAPTETSTAKLPAGPWLKLVRAGTDLRAFVSPDRQAWTEVGQLAMPFPGPLLLGLAVSGPAPDRLATAVFHSARVTNAPAPWIDSDIGDVAFPGSARMTADRVELIGTGSDIGGTSDQFLYLHRPFAGDGEITAHVVTFAFADPGSKVGLMFRAGPGPGAPHLSLLLTPLGNVLLRRPAPGASTLGVMSTLGQLPQVWLRMTRIGSLVDSYLSPDGVSWQRLRREDLAMTPPGAPPSPPLTSVGLVLSARSNGRVSGARLDKVVVTTYPPYPVDAGPPPLPGVGLPVPSDAGAPADAAPEAP